MNLSCHAFAEPPVNITWMYTKKKKKQSQSESHECHRTPPRSSMPLQSSITASISTFNRFNLRTAACTNVLPRTSTMFPSVDRSLSPFNVRFESLSLCLACAPRTSLPLDSPRIFLLNKPILRHSLTDRVQLGCRVCAVPTVDTVHWLRNEQAIIDANILIKSRILNEQCSESIMEILVCCRVSRSTMTSFLIS